MRMKKIIATVVGASALAVPLAGTASADVDSYLGYIADNNIAMGWYPTTTNMVANGNTLCRLMGSGLSVDQIVADNPFVVMFDIRGAAHAASLHLC